MYKAHILRKKYFPHCYKYAKVCSHIFANDLKPLSYEKKKLYS